MTICIDDKSHFSIITEQSDSGYLIYNIIVTSCMVDSTLSVMNHGRHLRDALKCHSWK